MDFNWQCYLEAELDAFFEFITKDIILAIINTDTTTFGKKIVELNDMPQPILFIPTNEDIRFYKNFHCDLDKCTNCYKKEKCV
jgi:hypothetical protein